MRRQILTHESQHVLVDALVQGMTSLGCVWLRELHAQRGEEVALRFRNVVRGRALRSSSPIEVLQQMPIQESMLLGRSGEE